MDRSPVLEVLVADIRDAYAACANELQRWERIGRSLRTFLQKPEVQSAGAQWTVPSQGGPYNLRFHEDEQYGFMVHGLLKEPGIGTPIHDHGDTWTAYGLLQGEETITIMAPTDSGDYAMVQRRVVGTGHVDVVPPSQMHAEHSGSTRTVAIIVRSGRVDNRLQTHLDPKSKEKRQAFGPKQIPAAFAVGMSDLGV